ncbi:MAG: SgcJ/EcaC family oxidoreductase [Acidimicrobiales bacterium]
MNRWQAKLSHRVAILLVGLAVIGCGGSEKSEIETVERLADDLAAAWVENDATSIATIFAADGVFVDTLGREHVGSDSIAQHVEQWGELVTESRRTGPIEELDDGTYVFPIEMVFDGQTLVGKVVVNVQDALFVRHDWVDGPPENLDRS